MQEKNKELTRRQFIKWSAGAAGLLAALSTPFALEMKRATASGDQHAAKAQGEKKARAWAMVVDLRKCEGCVTIDSPPQCTQACINGHYVPKGQEWIQVFEKELPGGGRYFMPTPCYQCEAAPCVNVCPVAATYHNEDGIVLVDQRRCIGCRMCMAACPYQRRFFTWGEPELPPEAALSVNSPLYPVPSLRGTVIKCMFCAHFLRDGKLPFCVAGCPMKALYMGDLNSDVATNGQELVQLSRFLDSNNAYRYKEELGTQPRVWYLPGYGQNFGRHPDDEHQLKPPQWSWGGKGFDTRPGILESWEETK